MWTAFKMKLCPLWRYEDLCDKSSSQEKSWTYFCNFIPYWNVLRLHSDFGDTDFCHLSPSNRKKTLWWKQKKKFLNTNIFLYFCLHGNNNSKYDCYSHFVLRLSRTISYPSNPFSSTRSRSFALCHTLGWLRVTGWLILNTIHFNNVHLILKTMPLFHALFI